MADVTIKADNEESVNEMVMKFKRDGVLKKLFTIISIKRKSPSKNIITRVVKKIAGIDNKYEVHMELKEN